MSNVQEEITGDKVFTGNVQIFGEINNPNINKLVTRTEQTDVYLQKVRASVSNIIDSFAADGVITPIEKKILKSYLNEITTEYSVLVQRAKEKGLSQTASELTGYTNAYNAINSFFIGSAGILLDMASNSVISPDEFTTTRNNYTYQKNILINAITDTVENQFAQFFHDETVPPGPYKAGDFWVHDHAIFISTADRAAGEGTELDWEWYIRPNITTVIESSNGDVFKPGQAMTTILRPRCFRNGLEITDTLPDSAFRWTRTSFYPQPAPNDDATWNQNHAAGYRTIEVTAASIYARATYTVDIIE